MTNYRRIYTPGATWFFTVNLAARNNNKLLIDKIEQLRQAFRYVKQKHPFIINAVVIMPDHLHCIWTLPVGDSDYSTRWSLIKAHFSHAIEKGEFISASRQRKNERSIWQRRFWAHLITDENDFNQHIDYIHNNPVKHGLTKRVVDWRYSSFHHYVKLGIYPSTWGWVSDFDIKTGE
ncbi:transposase [Methylobacter sp. S3L5C]|uniref:REP-associated tyrosine transposase n=1 Tax=Methylobacter sp. S3L5C TaxID=2839024 RepID=UPI001FACB909|nr:transposase [Methylobacter sp. S3L5C]UOA08558.1 transposase [Methylobacter sp. S3L5C]